MENGSSPSLDASQFVDDLLKEQERAGTPAGPDFSHFVEDLQSEELGNLAQAAKWAQKFDPEAYSRASGLLPGLPPEVALRQLPEAERQARMNQFGEIFQRAPSMRQHFLANPKDLAYANPDELDNLSGVNWALNAFPQSFSQGQEITELGLLGDQALAGQLSAAELRTLEARYANMPERTFGDRGGWFSGAVVGAAQTLPTMGNVILNSITQGLKGSILGGATGGAIGVLGGPLGVGAGTVSGAGIGFKTGAAYGALEQSIKIQSGLNYLEFRSIRDESGNRLDDNVARWAALLSGIGAGGLETLGLGATLRAVPGLNQLTSYLTRDGMKTALKNPTLRSALTTFAKNMGVAVSTEVLTEMGQEGLTILGKELSKANSNGDFKMMTGEEIAQDVIGAGVQAAQVMTLLAPIASGTGFASDIITMSKTKRSNDNLKTMARNIADNKLVQRKPEVAAQIIDGQAGDQKLYIPAQEMQELYQSQNLDVYGPAIPNWRHRFDEALSTGGDVTVSVGEFMTALGQDPDANPLYGLVRTDPRDYLPRDIEEYAEGLDELMMSDLQRAEKRVVEGQDVKANPPDTRVEDYARESIEALGFTPEAANHVAVVLGGFAKVKARQLNVDPLTWVQENLPRMIRVDQDGGITMEASDPTIANGNQPDQSLPEELYQPAWHGSPHLFDQFDLSKIGTGEGAQAFGWGLYFAQNREIAEGYRNRLSRNMAQFQLDGQPIGNVRGAYLFDRHYKSGMTAEQLREAFNKEQADVREAFREEEDYLAEYNRDPAAFVKNRQERFGNIAPWRTEEAAKATLERNIKVLEDHHYELATAIERLEGVTTLERPKATGRLFQVDLPDNDALLAWDDAIGEQSELVQQAMFAALEAQGQVQALKDIYGEEGLMEVPGSTLYSTLEQSFEDWEADTPDMSPATRGDRAASELLLQQGIKGHRFADAGSRGSARFRVEWTDGVEQYGGSFTSRSAAESYIKEEYGNDATITNITETGTYNYVIYDDKAIEVIEYLQDQRGSITFAKDSKALIKLFNKADMSTLLHEAGHWFLETTKNLAAQSPEIDADWQVIKKKLGIGDDGKITRAQHEEFARMAEAYFMEGKAPTAELRSAFQAFRQWLKAIYRSITKIGGAVSPEIRTVFDNMLRTEQQFDAVANEPGYRPLFADAESMGIAPEDYLEYQRLVEDLRAEAQDGVVGKIVGQQKKLQTGWHKKIEAQLRTEAEEKLRTLPPYSHLAIMKEPEFSINTEMFGKKYGREAAKAFPRYAFNKTGLDPEVAANLLGYPTADEMVYDFTQALPIKEAAKAEAQAEMVRRYGDDISSQEVLDLAVRRAMAEDGRVTILAKEYKALSAKAGREVSENSPRQLAAEIARRTLYVKRFRDVNERQSKAAVKRAGAMAEAAVLKGDWATAANWKRKQMLAQALDNETQRLNETIEKIRDKAARYTRTTSKSIDPSTMEQIRDLVTRYEFTRVPLKKLDRRQSLAEYMRQAELDGLVLNVPEYLTRQLGRMNYREMTVEDLFGLGDTLDNLEHIGRLKHKLRTSKGLREFAEIRSTLLDSIRQRPSNPVKMKNYAEEKRSALIRMKAWFTDLQKPEQIVKWLDLGNIGGPMMEYVFQPIADAQTVQNDMMVQYTNKIMEAFEKIPSDHLTSTRAIKSLNSTMTMEQIYAVALNLGNDSNKQKMMEGELWTERQIAEITSHLDGKDWERIQKIWNLLDGLWTKISAMEKRLTGVAPPRVEGREFTNQYGTFKGGYYPVIYDFNAKRGLNLIEDTRPEDWKLDGLRLFQQRFIKPGTNHTHTYKRQKVAKPIKLELAVLPGHVQKVIHDLAYREPVRAAYKILSDPDIKQAITDVESEFAYDQFSHWIQQVASEHSVESNPQTQLITHVRLGASIFGMGFRLSVGLAQGLGFFNSLVEVPVRHLSSGIYRMTVNPYQTLEVVNTLSGEMRHRFNAMDRDIRDYTQRITTTKTKLDYVRDYAFWHIGMLDKWVASATWMGAYNDFLERNPGKDELAIRHADRTVRLTQGTGNVKDFAKVMNSGEVLKLFTMFYSAFSAIWNMQVDLTRQTKRDIAEGDWYTLFTQRLPQWSYLVVFPAIFGALLSGNGPEEDEDKLWWAARKAMLYPAAGVPFVRDIVGSAESGFDYKLSPAGRIFESTVRSLGILFDSDSDFVDKAAAAAKPTATAISLGLKLPTGQAINTVESLWKGLENNDLELKDLMYGRRDK